MLEERSFLISLLEQCLTKFGHLIYTHTPHHAVAHRDIMINDRWLRLNSCGDCCWKRFLWCLVSNVRN